MQVNHGDPRRVTDPLDGLEAQHDPATGAILEARDRGALLLARAVLVWALAVEEVAVATALVAQTAMCPGAMLRAADQEALEDFGPATAPGIAEALVQIVLDDERGHDRHLRQC